MKSLNRSPEKGFTILELMIATTVFATILLIVTSAMIGIGNLFYKGYVLSRTQDAVRSGTDQISQDVELESTAPSSVPVGPKSLGPGYPAVNGIYAYCVGDTRYSYTDDPNLQIGSGIPSQNQIPHLLWRDKIVQGNCVPENIFDSDPNTGMGAYGGTDGQELVPTSTRLTDFSITLNPNGLNYSINLGMAYGDSTETTGVQSATLCKGGAGDQYCATDYLNSLVVRRKPL